MEYSPSSRVYGYPSIELRPAERVNNLTLDGAAIEDLGMTMEYSPSSRVYGYPSIELRPGGGDESVTVHNVEEFVERTVDWALYRGVRSQLEALRAGFNTVFPMDRLGAFTPDEMRTLLCGDQD